MKSGYPFRALKVSSRMVSGLSAICLCSCIAFLVAACATSTPPAPETPSLSSSPGVLFEDDFISEAASIEKGWLISTSDDTDIVWSPNKLTIAVKKKEYGQFDWPNIAFRDFGVEIEAEPSNDASTQYARYGILFGIADESGKEMYDFGVTTTGEYSLARVSDGKMVQPMLVDFVPSPCLQPRPSTNRLGVLVEGSNISLYINGSQVNTIIDDSIKSGYVGVSVNSFWSDRAEVSFHRMTVMTVEKAKAEWGSRLACAPQPPSDGIWLNDDFSSEQASRDKGWPFESNAERETRWSPDGYVVTVKDKLLREISRPVGNFSNFGVEIEAQPDPGSSLEYGISFRYNAKEDIPDDYVFGLVIRSKDESYYYLAKETNGKLVEPYLVSLRSSSSINPNWAKNRLGVLADGSLITLYINGRRIKTIEDGSLGSGEVGVFVGTLDSQRSEAAFSRMTIYTAEKAKAEWGTPPPLAPGILYQADFRSEQALGDDGWDIGSNNAADNVWSPGKMTMSVKVQHYLYVSGPRNDSFDDFGVEIEAQPEDDPGYSYGILFRESALGRDRPSYYIFAVNSGGYYILRRQTEGVFAEPDPVEFTYSRLIQKGSAKNRLGVLAEGSSISLYINGNCIRTITADAPLNGKVEVFILSGSKDRTQVEFSRMTIYTVQEAKKQWGPPATVVPEPTGTPGILFEDDFASKEKSVELGWTLGSFEDQERVWSPNQLTMVIKKKGAWDIALAGPPNDDFGVQVEARPQDKPGIQYGLVFRYSVNQDQSNFYLFSVTVQGEYSVLKMVDGKWASENVVPITASPYILKGAVKNRLGVLAEGSTISLYANGNLVKSFTDSSLSWGGIGPFAFSGPNEPAEVYFSRVTIYSVESAKIELEKK